MVAYKSYFFSYKWSSKFEQTWPNHIRTCRFIDVNIWEKLWNFFFLDWRNYKLCTCRKRRLTEFLRICNYCKRLGDTWWLLSMRLRTRLGHGQYLFLCKAHRRSIEIWANQIVGCWSWIIQACVSVLFQWKLLREPSKNIHEKIETLRSMIYNFRSPRYGQHMHDWCLMYVFVTKSLRFFVTWRQYSCRNIFRLILAQI